MVRKVNVWVREGKLKQRREEVEEEVQVSVLMVEACGCE